ncbi:phosphate/phosphite/phosphonate ABC transporter substrate-binding protein [Terasakiella sp. SH-1]|uniref:phosphate/phosphite/phosphonate ABC transporter substrate-binding protein n=1 Tax=Terasakiella sp. SH-1 TaxID=2560057 RepID=UPI001073D3DC|nr:phosphate/phosphite/phosphonate ABC transporter substrate-binding protein [Terasakiella sp. SH-1]
MKKKFIAMLFSYVLLLSPSANGAEKITFAISPERNVSELARLWIPVLNELEKISGLELKFETAPNAEQFNQKLKKGGSTIVFVDPYAFSSLLSDHYTALAKPQNPGEENAPLGLVVVHKKSPYKTLDDLGGKSFSFSSAESFSASVLPRFHMQATGIPYKASFARSSMSSVLAVSRGLQDAAGLEASFYHSLPKSLKRNLRIVWTSTPSDLCQGMKNHPFVFAVHKTLSNETAAKLQSALLSLNDSLKGRNLIKQLGFNKIQLAHNQDWTGLKPIALRVLAE